MTATNKNLVLLGAGGQLGRSFIKSWQASMLSEQFNLLPFNRAELDITDSKALSDTLGFCKPAVIVNAAAYTAVDKAEADSETAFLINEKGAANVATAAVSLQSRLIHLSTDFVFAGRGNSAIKVDDETKPASVYGHSKLAGEQAVKKIAGREGVIVRTSWLYSSHGSNFLNTMLSLMLQKDELAVVADQIGTPTSTDTLVQFLFALIAQTKGAGVYHWSDAGVASWYDFAIAIQEEARATGLLDRSIQIRPITSKEYPTPAQRPVFSVLDKSISYAQVDCPRPHWRAALRDVLSQLKT